MSCHFKSKRNINVVVIYKDKKCLLICAIEFTVGNGTLVFFEADPNFLSWINTHIDPRVIRGDFPKILPDFRRGIQSGIDKI